MSYFTNNSAKQQSVALLQKILLTLYDENCFEIHEKIVAFHKVLVFKYTNCEDYLLYHVLMGSTPPEICGNWDFPEEHSIQDFILKEYKIRLPKLSTQAVISIPSREGVTVQEIS